MIKSAITKQAASELQRYAKRINELEADIQQCDNRSRAVFADSISRRIEQGHELIQAQLRCPKGEWEWWCENNTTLSKSTVERRMKDARNPSRLTGARAQHEVLALESGQQEAAATEPRQLVPYLEAIGRATRLIGYIGKHPLAEWPAEGKDKLRDDLRPIVLELGGTL